MTLRRLREQTAALEMRARILAAVRGFFSDRGFLEVETPVRIAAPALERYIEAEPSGEAYLRTSPELHMKRLVAAGLERIYQIGPCFRRGERGRAHRPEYTMLEWYRMDADYLDMLVDAKALLARVFEEACGGTTIRYRGREIEIMPVWECRTVAEVFRERAGWNPVAAFDADRFDADLVTKIEPSLSPTRPTVLTDYPVQAAALARRRAEPPHEVAERWELYLGGLELANAFSELTDPAEQRQRFEACAAARAAEGRAVYPMDEAFLAALEAGLPPCGGVALGVDRLVMLATDSDGIEAVRPFDA